MDKEDSESWLRDDAPDAAPVRAAAPMPPWKVLVVDDEADVHNATRFALSGIVYKDREIQLMSAYSGKEGLLVMRRETDIALVLLDVVMETADAGLRLARQVREELNNQMVRLVLRTGQPGQAPERDVVLQYDINDYKNKTELTGQKLFTTVIASLRAYEGLLTIERSRQGLERILAASTDLYHVRSLREFSSGVLNQITALLDVGANGVLCLFLSQAESGDAPVIMAATGDYAAMGKEAHIPESDALLQVAKTAFAERRSHLEHPHYVLHVGTPDHREFVILVSPPWPLADYQRRLLENFCTKIGWAFDNLHAFNGLRHAQDAFLEAVRRTLLCIEQGNRQDLPAALRQVSAHLASYGEVTLDQDALERKLLAATNT
ncbi:DUF3369 domain-containing protein [Rhodoferax aquaticus]|nr:DUF3369 domain-containing protein [Rhodoferax aquaticus]